MFKITEGKGFHMTFKNGYTISVQFGTMNYCSNRSMEYEAVAGPASKTAEIAAWNQKGLDYVFPDGDTVKGWLTTDDVNHWMNVISEL